MATTSTERHRLTDHRYSTDEFALDAVVPSIAQAQQVISQAVHTHNLIRLYGSLDLQSPVQVLQRGARPRRRPTPA